mmetsp:Transcript_148384/g.413419  ORF Transcript_148384/g.413419 Transcript_148384/m.413419 type:complete len:249 (+) Transcript_148384:654-1400(+)
MANVEHVKGATCVNDAVLLAWLTTRGKLRDAPRASQELHCGVGTRNIHPFFPCRRAGSCRRTPRHNGITGVRHSAGRSRSLQTVLQRLDVCGVHLILCRQLVHKVMGSRERSWPATSCHGAVLDGVVGPDPHPHGGRLEPCPHMLRGVLVPRERKEPPDDVSGRDTFSPLDNAQATSILHLVVSAHTLSIHGHVVTMDAEVRSCPLQGRQLRRVRHVVQDLVYPLDVFQEPVALVLPHDGDGLVLLDL